MNMKQSQHKALQHNPKKSREEHKTLVERIANFKGRTGRAEFYIGSLICCIAFILVQLVTQILFAKGGNYVMAGAIVNIIGLIATVYFFSVSIRRLHDLGHSGAWVLLYFTGIGLIGLLIYLAKPGLPGPNQYGEPPSSGLN